jgi:hypothetical protein
MFSEGVTFWDCVFRVGHEVGWLVAAAYLAQEWKAKGSRFGYLFWRTSYYVSWGFIAIFSLMALGAAVN